MGIIILLGFFLICFLFISSFIKSAKKRVVEQKGSFWKGKLIDKEHLEYEDDDSPHTKDLYTLYFKTDEEKPIKINVPKKIFDLFNINDQAEKKVGELYPEKK